MTKWLAAKPSAPRRAICAALWVLAIVTSAGFAFHNSRSAAHHEIAGKIPSQAGPNVSVERAAETARAQVRASSHATTVSSVVRGTLPHRTATLNPAPSLPPDVGKETAALPATAAANNSVARAKVVANYASLPLRFEENQGQADPQVKFLSHGQGYTLFLTQKEAVLSIIEPQKNVEPSRIVDPDSAALRGHPTAALRVKFSGTTDAATVTGQDQLQSKTNYFLGNDPKQWRTGVPNYAAVEYHGLYPGIDAVFHGSRQQFEFDFDVAPGADPSKAELEIEGSAKPLVNAQGNIVLSVAGQTEITLGKPNIYQDIAGQRREVAGNFVVHDGNRVGFSLGDYDHSLPLVIDPTFNLVYSTYIGGNLTDAISGVAEGFSPSGTNLGTYLVGTTDSTIFPTTTPQIPTSGAFQTTCQACSPGGFNSAFVAKFDTSQNLVYYTYLGPYANPPLSGGYEDLIGSASGNAIAVDSSGNAYITGQTNSGYFPYGFPPSTTSPQPYPGGPFVSELSSDGTTLLNSASVEPAGGSSRDQGNGIALDNKGNVYVVGTTTTPGLATTNAVQTTSFGSGPFVAEFNFSNTNPSMPSYYTYLLGTSLLGSSGDVGAAIAVDPVSGNVFVGGTTANPNPPLGANTITGQGTFRLNSSFEWAGFVAELNPTTSPSSLLYFSYLWGPDTHNPVGSIYVIDGTQVMALAIDSGDNIYVTGRTDEPDLPTTTQAVGGASVCETETVGTVSGLTECPRGFVAEFNPNVSGAQSLATVSYFGGITPDPASFSYGTVGNIGTAGNGIAVDQNGDIFVTGGVTTSDFPETGLNPTSAGAAQGYQPYVPLEGTLPCGTAPCESGYLAEFSPGAINIWYSTYFGVGNGSDYGTGLALDSKSNIYLVGSQSGSTTTIPFGAPLIATPPSAQSGFFSVLNVSTGTPLISFSPAAANLSSTNTTIQLTVTNTGNSPMDLISWYAYSQTSPNPFSIVSPPCGVNQSSSLLPGSSCTLTISFTPPAVAGQYNGTIIFADTALQGDDIGQGNFEQTYYIEGTSTGSGATLTSITVSPSNPSVSVGGTEPFTANGGFSDGSTQSNIQGVTWSVNPVSTVATITSTSGVATAENVGLATIQASKGGVIGTTTLTVTRASTITTLASTYLGSTIAEGQPFTLTATVTSNGSPLNQVPVTFYDGAIQLATGVMTNVNGQAGFNANSTSLPLAPGAHSFTASFGGNTNYSLSSSSPAIALTVLNPTTITLTSPSPGTSVPSGTAVTLTANLTGGSPAAPLSGQTVTFYDNGTTNLGTGPATNASGDTSLTVSSLAVGSHSLTASFAGNATYSAGTSSPPVSLTVTAALTSIAVTPSNPSIALGGTQQFTATGTYSNSSTANITTSVTWQSQTQTVATFSTTTPGLATGVGTGTSQITAALGSVASPAVALTVTPPPPPPPANATATYVTTPINFGNVASGSTATQYLYVFNCPPAATGNSCSSSASSAASFTVTSATVSGTNSPFSFTGVVTTACSGTPTPSSPNGLPLTLAPGQGCELSLQYAPPATESDSAYLQIVDNAENGNLANVSTTGGIQRNVPLFGNSPTSLGNGQLITIAGSTSAPNGACQIPGWSFISDPQCAQTPGEITGQPTCSSYVGPVPLCNAGYGGDGQLATSSTNPPGEVFLNLPYAVAVGPDGTVYIADWTNKYVRIVSATTGDINTIALQSGLQPGNTTSVAADGAGNVYFGDTLGNIWTWNKNIGADPSLFTSFSGGQTVNAVTTDSNNNLYAFVVPGFGLETEAPEIFEFCGSSSTNTSSCFGGTERIVTNGFNLGGAVLYGLAADSSGNVYSFDGTDGAYPGQIIELQMSSGDVIPVSPAPSMPGAVSGGGISNLPSSSLAMDSNGNFYLLNANGNLLQEYTPTGPLANATGTLTIVAGTGSDGYNVPYPSPYPPFAVLSNYYDDGPFPAVQTDLNAAEGVAVDKNSAIYIADTANNLIRKIVAPNTPAGTPVSVTPVDTTTGTSPLTVTFSSVSQPGGGTTLTETTIGPTSSGYTLASNPPVYLYLSSDAPYSEPIQICLNLGALGVNYTSGLVLMHYVNGVGTPYTLTLNPSTGEYCTLDTIPSLSPFALEQPIPVTLTISPTTLSAATAGAAYTSVGFTASGATGTVTVTENGSLPTGMMFTSGSTGTLSGTPTQTGSYPIAINASDTNNDTGMENLTLTVNCPTINVTPTTLANGTYASAYSQQFGQTGGVGKIAFSETGALPTPMTFSAAGLLSGTPTQVGSFPFTVTATDSNACTGQIAATLTVKPISTTTTITSTSSSFGGVALPASTALVGNPVTVNYTVTPSAGGASATGGDKVSDGFTPADSCSGALSEGGGSCALTISQLGAGTTSLTAAYTPDANSTGLSASTSTAVVTENIAQIINCGTSAASQSVARGSTASYSFSVCRASDVTSAPTVAVTNCPTQAQCNGTATATATTGLYTVAVTVVPGTASRTVPLRYRLPLGGSRPMILFAFGVFLAMLIALQLARQNRSRPRLLYVTGLLFALILCGMSGCASNSSSSGSTGTPPNTYTVNVQVTAGSFNVNVPLNLTVTQ